MIGTRITIVAAAILAIGGVRTGHAQEQTTATLFTNVRRPIATSGLFDK